MHTNLYSRDKVLIVQKAGVLEEEKKRKKKKDSVLRGSFTWRTVGLAKHRRHIVRNAQNLLLKMYCCTLFFFSFSNEHCTSHAHLPYSSGEDFSRIQVDGRIGCGDGKFAQHHEDQLQDHWNPDPNVSVSWVGILHKIVITPDGSSQPVGQCTGL